MDGVGRWIERHRYPEHGNGSVAPMDQEAFRDLDAQLAAGPNCAVSDEANYILDEVPVR